MESKRFLLGGLDYLFPSFCVSCGREGAHLCAHCAEKSDAPGVFACPLCHRGTGTGAACGACARKSSLGGVAACAVYDERQTVGRLIRLAKYEYIADALSLCASFISVHARVLAERERISAVVPVPLHARRFAERGFNQAEIIAGIAASATDVPVLRALRRTRYTAQQVRLSRSRRADNVFGAFVLKKDADVCGLRVLLVDDVFTTGATMQECARTLKRAGADRVFGFCLARG